MEEMSGKAHQKPLGVMEGNVYEFAGPHSGEGVAESQQEDLEMPYKRTARALGDDVHLVNREQEVCRLGSSSHSVATGQ